VGCKVPVHADRYEAHRPTLFKSWKNNVPCHDAEAHAEGLGKSQGRNTKASGSVRLYKKGDKGVDRRRTWSREGDEGKDGAKMPASVGAEQTGPRVGQEDCRRSGAGEGHDGGGECRLKLPNKKV